MGFNLIVFLFVGFIFHSSQGSVSMSFCNISCRDGGVLVPGPPGKPGQAGQKGEKGDIGPQGAKGVSGESCNCAEYGRELRDLKTELQALRSFTMAGWQRMSNGRWYKLFKSRLTYIQAKSSCAEVVAHLAASGLRDARIRREITDAFDFRVDAWIGLDDIEQEGRYVWIDDVVATSANTFWLSGQPDDAGVGEDCGVTWLNGRGLNDLNCNEKTYYLCETDVI